MGDTIKLELNEGQGIEFYEDEGIDAVLIDEKGEGLAHQRLSQAQINALRTLLDICIHEDKEHINIPGTYERISVCNTCGSEM